MMVLKYSCACALLLLIFANNASQRQQKSFSLIINTKRDPSPDNDITLLGRSIKYSGSSCFVTPPTSAITSPASVTSPASARLRVPRDIVLAFERNPNKNEDGGLKTLQKYDQEQAKKANKALLKKQQQPTT